MVISIRNGVPRTEQETEAFTRLDRTSPEAIQEMEQSQAQLPSEEPPPQEQPQGGNGDEPHHHHHKAKHHK